MTPTPIPEEFKKRAKEEESSFRYPEGGMNKDGDKKSRGHQRKFSGGAEWAYRLLASRETMRWVKARNEPFPTKPVLTRVTPMGCGLSWDYSMRKPSEFKFLTNQDNRFDVEWLKEGSAPIQQTMRWVKCTERLPPDVNKRYAARVKSMFGSDPILCVIKRSGSDSWLAGPIAGDYPSVTTESIIEWLDESTAPIQ